MLAVIPLETCEGLVGWLCRDFGASVSCGKGDLQFQALQDDGLHGQEAVAWPEEQLSANILELS